MFGRTKRTNAGGSSQHDSTQSSFGAVDKVSFYFIRTEVWIWSNLFSGYHIAQVRVVFELPNRVIPEVFSLLDTPPKHLAYVEWFTPIPATPDPKHGMYRMSKLTENGHRSASVIQVDSIVCSVHLIPQFGPVIPWKWNSFTVLELCNTFYVNLFADVQSYLRFV